MLPPPQLEKSWANVLAGEWQKPYMNDLARLIGKERDSAPVYPSKQEVFNAFNACGFDETQVVIIGQDPYHGPGQAHGLSFSVPRGINQPPSLKNIFKELKEDLGVEPPNHGCLEAWTKQGVLMLNAILTVRAREPRSHHRMGWEQFTDTVVQQLCERRDPVIFVLWGKSAQEKCQNVLAAGHHHVLTAPHPSPYSVHTGFFGCKHFSKINDLLTRQGKEPINWAIS